jgi:hypothetical protein
MNNTIIINDFLMNYVKYFLTDKEQIVAVLKHPDDGMRNTVVDNYRVGLPVRSSGKHYRTLPIFTGHVRRSFRKTADDVAMFAILYNIQLFNAYFIILTPKKKELKFGEEHKRWHIVKNMKLLL